MKKEDIIKNNAIIAEFMNKKLQSIKVHHLKYTPEDYEKNNFNYEDCYQYDIRDFDDPFCYKYYEELLVDNDDQTPYHPMVLEFRNRYFIYGKSGYYKSALNDYMEINKEMIPYSNAIDLKYHSSWDWLFPVLSKINKIKNELYEDYYKGTKLAIKFNYNTSLAECIMNLEDISVLDADIKECHKLATKFAKWYNKQKK